jgi:8-oxo-dGTP pyrophosphatase MutT (NUDIX family)
LWNKIFANFQRYIPTYEGTSTFSRHQSNPNKATQDFYQKGVAITFILELYSLKNYRPKRKAKTSCIVDVDTTLGYSPPLADVYDDQSHMSNMASQPNTPLSFYHSPSLAPFAITVEEYLTQHPEYNGLAGGAMVFDSEDRLLIVQRAAHDSMPNLWEIPGGACDSTDESILHGITREVFEETGLRVKALRHLVRPGNGHVVFKTGSKGLIICKFNFEVEVESTEAVTLDPNEHQNYLWITEGECREYQVEREGKVVKFQFTTPAQEMTILEGFRLRKATKPAGR